jgi:hypothetical protein
MARVRDALVDFSGASITNGQILSYLKDALGVAILPGEFAPDPQVVDPLDDTVVDPAKWAVVGSGVSEGTFLGRDAIIMSGPAVPPAYDTDGVIYKPAIAGAIGAMWHSKFILTEAVEWLAGLQEYAFTVDNVVTPTTWSLKYNTPQVPDNSTMIRFRPGRIQIVRGGASGQFIDVPDSSWLASHPTDVSRQYPLNVAFVFTQTGFQIWVHQPGVWDAARLVHTETRSALTQPTNGYSFCVNKYTTDSFLAFFDPSTGFRNDAVVSGAVMHCATIQDQVQLNTLDVDFETGGVIGQNGFVTVRFPTLGPTAYTLAQVAELAAVLSDADQHPVEFLLSGDVALKHPTRINILDNGLQEETTEG